jgi:glycosyltransferase involved in cell wall biosynthesis
MKIAQVAPLAEAVPPKLYGGTERVVAYLTDALVELGHEVTLFASGDSATKATLAPVWPRALRLDPDVKDHLAPMFMQLETVARRAHEFDVIHSHIDPPPCESGIRSGTLPEESSEVSHSPASLR